jgi:hypothetical protein
MLKNVLPFSRPKIDGRIGFVYTSEDETGPMREAQIGRDIQVEGRGPPWIVVCEAPETVIVVRWPGRLWKVKILEAATAYDQLNHGGTPNSYARYTRALSVRILTEENPAIFFGPNGCEIVQILDRVQRLTVPEAQYLSLIRPTSAADAYDRVLRRWCKAEDVSLDYEGSLDGFLGVGPMFNRSPIGDGLSVVSDTLTKRAITLDGPTALQADDEDETNLTEPWGGALAVLLDAALALGSPDVVTGEERGILLSPWMDFVGSC